MLTEPDDLDTYILALAEESLISAWQYQRTFPDKSEIRTRLARKVLVWCFSREPHFVPTSQVRALTHGSKATP